MSKYGIAIDDWKLPIFERHLIQAGYTFTQSNGLTEGTLTLTVVSHNPVALGEVVRVANAEAARTGAPRDANT